MYPEPTELLLIGCLIESNWTQDPNQIHWHHEPTRRRTDKGKFHTWWMESSFVFVQHLRSNRACLDCIRKPGENQIWKSERTSELVKCAARKYGETRIWQICHRWWYGLWHRRRIELLSETTFILEQSEWPIAKDVGPFSRRFNARHWQTFCDLVNVYVFESGSICMHGKELLRQFASHQKYRRKSHFWSR